MSSETSLRRGVCQFGAAVVPSRLRQGRAARVALGVVVVLMLLFVAPARAGELDFTPNIHSEEYAYTGLHLADMTGDGVKDVLFGNRNTNKLEIYRYNASDRGYLERIDEVWFVDDPHDVKAADLDNDGDQDLVVGLRREGLYIAKNTGGPGVGGSWEVGALDYRYSWQVSVADIDGDGNLDILDGINEGLILPFYGDGHGGFAEGASIEDPDSPMPIPRGFNLFDHNGDGRPDLIGVDGAYLRVFINPGNRTTAWASVGNVLLGAYPSLRPLEAAANVSPSAGDLNGDGAVDQVAFVGTPEEVGAVNILILEGNGTTWTPRILDTLPWRNFAGHAGVADLNGDGHLDVHVGGGRYFDGLRVYLGDGQGSFRREDVPLAYGVGSFNSFATGDVTGDGRADIIASLTPRIGPPIESGGFVLLTGASPTPNDPIWMSECIECQPGFAFNSITPGSLKIDQYGNPHVIVGGTDLVYLRRSGQTWQRELVELGMGFNVQQASLALDTQGQPHISYWTGGNSALRYAHRTAAGWQIETVETNLGTNSGRASLALDAQGQPHIAYEGVVDDAVGTKAVRYAYRYEAEWITQPVAGESKSPSLAIGGDGTAYLSFVADGQLQYAERAMNGPWAIIPVGSETATDTSLALASNGKVRIAYSQNGAIKLASFATPTWEIELVAAQASYQWPVLALGAANAIHISYVDDGADTVNHVYRSGGTWQTSPIASVKNPKPVSLAVDPAGTPHAIYVSYDDDELIGTLFHEQATGPTGGWLWGNRVAAVQEGSQGKLSLALDAAARPAMSYCDYSTNAVIFARRESGGWVRQVVDDMSGICLTTVLALDGGGKAHIVYLVGNEDGGVTKLVYARQTGSGWNQESLETSPTDGNLTLALDNSARPHVVYGRSAGDVITAIYAYRTATGWQRETLATDINYAFSPSLQLDRQGRPHVAYRRFQSPVSDVRYGYRDAAGWHTETVRSSQEEYLLYPQLALGSDGGPQIVFYSVVNDEWVLTFYARRGTAGWEVGQIHRRPYQEMGLFEANFRLDPNNQPLIAMNAPYFGGVFLGTRDDAGWQWEQLRSFFINGLDMALDAGGAVHLAGSYDQLVYMTARRIEPAVGDPEQIISAGEYHTCGLRPSGQADCWGAAAAGNPGQATDQAGPFVQVGAGALHSCGLRPNGSVDCWGSNTFDQAADQTGPFTQLSVGGDHNCALRADGRAVCWGRNSYGESADWSGPFVQIGAGWQTTCGLRPDGGVTCWGSNVNGRAQSQPGPFVQLSVGWGHACGLELDGGVHCWGWNKDGQATDQAGPFVQISAGGRHTCGLKADGSAFCWGRSEDGEALGRPGPFRQVSAGGTWQWGDEAWGHTCGIRLNGDVECWGNNDSGQIAAPGGVFGPFRPLTWLPVVLRNR